MNSSANFAAEDCLEETGVWTRLDSSTSETSSFIGSIDDANEFEQNENLDDAQSQETSPEEEPVDKKHSIPMPLFENYATLYGFLKNRNCGYCNRPENCMYGFQAHRLSVDCFESLLNTGWSRSGKFMYYPMNDKTCCPQYGTRLEVSQFTLGKTHRTVVRNFNRFLSDSQYGIDEWKRARLVESAVKDTCPGNFDEMLDGHDPNSLIDEEGKGEISNFVRFLNNCLREATESVYPGSEFRLSVVCNAHRGLKQRIKRGDFSTDAPRILRIRTDSQLESLQLWEKKLSALFLAKSEYSDVSFRWKIDSDFILIWVNTGSYLADQLDSMHRTPPRAPFTAKANTFKPSPNDEKKSFSETKAHDLTFRMVPAEFTAEKFRLFERFQLAVHPNPAQPVTETSFTNFLCVSPLHYSEQDDVSIPPPPAGFTYGSFHEEFYLDGDLIAVAVLDILPNCYHSVYFFYDPRYRNVNLGTYSALREIERVRSMMKLTDGRLRYYYLGSFVPSCPKVLYKTSFEPTYLLCPETLRWVPFSPRCKEIFKSCDYSRLAEPGVTRLPGFRLEPDEFNYDDIMVWYEGDYADARSVLRREHRDDWLSVIGSNSLRIVIVFSD